METTFVIKPGELNSGFLAMLKKLFKHSNQIQISVSAAEDFDLTKKETPAQSLQRMEKCLADMNQKEHTIAFTEEELDQIILEKL